MKDTEFTSYDVDRALAVKQMVHYLHLKQSAVTIDDKQEVRRTTDILDQLVTEYGVQALIEAEGELL
ncbi:hypothetical protein LOY55_06585 [Pseudomonas sp. B21-040]|uniref:hypothetical protein n=1 Tax=Pseudomonas sp. B21-040 TaxID=2895486 RepID=UPI00215DD84A|nr:hypothetical protein [Pseudomonas sp. B21-040]UVL41767.1 hypothetical protein LOY55_06585 [Pseudomonas sp. B21-040]